MLVFTRSIKKLRGEVTVDGNFSGSAQPVQYSIRVGSKVCGSNIVPPYLLFRKNI